MKIKHLIILGLVLAILTMSAVSASQDIADDANLTADATADDSVSESVVDKLISTDENEELSDIQSNGFEVNITKNINISESDWEDRTLVSIYCPENASGKLHIVMAEPSSSSPIDQYIINDISEYKGTILNVSCREFEFKEVGEFDVIVNYTDSEIGRETIKVTKIIYSTDFEFQAFPDDFRYGDVMELWPYVSGNLTVYVDGTQHYNRHYDKGNSYINVNKTDLGLTNSGEYNISAKYITDEYGTVDLKEWTYLLVDENIKYVIEEIDLKGTINPIAVIQDPENITGTVTITIDGKEVYKKSFTNDGTQLIISRPELDYVDIAHGTHILKVTYNKTNSEEHSLERSILLYETPQIYIPNFMFEGEKEGVIINANKNYTSIIKVYKSYEIYGNKELVGTTSLINGFARISLENLNTGIHHISFEMIIDQLPGKDFGNMVKMITVKDNDAGYDSNISANKIVVGDSVQLALKGNLSEAETRVYVDGIEYTNITSNNDTATSIIKDLSIGEHYITIIIKGISLFGEGKYSNTFVVKVINPIDPNLKITVASVHKSETPVIKITTNAAFSGKVNVKIGSKNYVVNVVKGKGTAKASTLKVGTYTAEATIAGNDAFKSSTKSVTFKVKADVIKLTLKKVKVKKSAKKLKITATLKINGKKVKGKKLKFKFKNKKYTAKTNKKGVAKITIKKKVLKKLKVGKKVKYTVSYGKKTVKKSVKVKK